MNSFNEFEWEFNYQNVNILILLMFAVYVISWYMQIGERWEFLGTIRFEFVLAITLSICALFVGTSFRSSVYPYLLLYILIVIIHVALSQDIATSWKVFVDNIIKYAFMGISIVFFVKSPKGLIIFFIAFLLAFLKMGQEGFLGKLTGSMMWQSQGVMRLHGATLLYLHPNSFAGTQIATLPFIYYFFSLTPLYIKSVLLIQGAFVANVALFSGSRTGYVAIVLYLFYMVLKSEYRKKIILYVVIFASISIVLIPMEYKERFESIFTQKEKEGNSAELRIEILEDAWHILLKNPLGIGVGAFPKVRNEYFGREQDTHNLYLEIATNLGIFGLIIFGLLIYKIFKTLAFLIKNISRELDWLLENSVLFEEKDQENKIKKHITDLKILKFSSLAVRDFLIIRLALGLFGHDLYEVYWWFAAGLTIAVFNVYQTAALRTKQISGLIVEES